jgi:hypothetical protein
VVVMAMKIDDPDFLNLTELLILFGNSIRFWRGGRWTSKKRWEVYRHLGLQRLYHQLFNRTLYESLQLYYVHLRSLRDAAIKEQKRKATRPKIIVLSSLTHPRDLFPWIINLASAPHLPQHSKFSVAPITSSLGRSHFMMFGNLCLEAVFRKCRSLLLSGIHEVMRVYCILVNVTQCCSFINRIVIGKVYKILPTFIFTIQTLLVVCRSVS